MTNAAALAWDTEWQGARCRGIDPNIFFTPDGKVSSLQKAKLIYRAKQICKDCPLRQRCLSLSIDNHEEFGVWGGMSEKDRRSLMKFRTNPPAASGTRSS